MKRRFLIASIIMTVVLALLLPSCGTDGLETATTVPELPSSTDAESETTAKPDMSGVKLEGSTFSVLYRYGAGSYDVSDVYSEGLNSEPVNDAVYTRNLLLEHDLGVSFKAVLSKSPVGMVRRTGFAGDDQFDLITDAMNQMFPQSLSGYYHNWRKLPHYVPSDPWWDSNADEALSVQNVVFLAVSDASMSASSNARFLYFNKHLCDLYGMVAPYDQVRAGTWTMDSFADAAVMSRLRPRTRTGI